MKKFVTLILLVLILIIPCISAEAYEINPAKWTFYQKEDYEIKPIQFDFSIKNTQAEGPITVELKPIMPQKLYGGNTAIPDLSWVTVAKSTITVQNNESQEATVIINIPSEYTDSNGTKHSTYNQSYEVWFNSKQVAGPGNIYVEYNCRWTIMTPTRYVPLYERADFRGTMYIVIGIVAVIIACIVAYVLISRRGRSSRRPKSTSRRGKKQDLDFQDIFK